MSLDYHETLEGFLKSWGMILASEIGDKTFFIAAIMAMKHSRLTVFSGAISALAAMTILSAALGWAAPNLLSKSVTHWAAIVLFMAFGLRSLYDAFFGETAEGPSEYEEVERSLQSKGSGLQAPERSPTDSKGQDDERGALKGASARGPKAQQQQGAAWQWLSPVWLETFTLTFLAEWGDRSQIATIGLAASTDVVGVALGGIVGHAICTGAAVLGGRHLATHIQERTVGIIGGVLFILFGLHALWEGPEH
ncbi:hypothetical protein WJX73_005176 [Symbiochloris irregularis]|uniref:GDT1 family protein n=1 Tax=Symbiochloris irregularis TaxID=706552 RepID=A0AAW1NRN2_9CHLO